MKKKGEAQGLGVGLILVAGITLIAALALLPAIFSNIGTSTSTTTVWNSTLTTSGTANTSVGIEGQELISLLSANNESDITIPLDTAGDDANITVTECIDPVSSLKSVCLTGVNADWLGVNVNISYTYGSDGYVDSAGGRSMVALIAIFTALAIAVVALTPTMRSGVLSLVKS